MAQQGSSADDIIGTPPTGFSFSPSKPSAAPAAPSAKALPRKSNTEFTPKPTVVPSAISHPEVVAAPGSDAVAVAVPETSALADAAQAEGRSILPNQDKPPLSLSSMILFALNDNPDVRMALAREEQAAANLSKAESRLFPIIDLVAEGGLSYDDPTAKGSSGVAWTRRFGLNGTQTVYDFGKTSGAIAQQKQLTGSAKLDTQVNVEETMNQTIESYLSILRYQLTLKSSAEFLARMRELNTTVQQTYEAGASNKAMVDYANSRLASAETDFNTLEANINNSKTDLEFLTGPLPAFDAVPPDDLDPARLDLKKYLDLAEAQNTGVQLSQSDLAALKRKLETTEKMFLPSINFVLTGEEKDNDGGLTDPQDQLKGVFQLSYRLYDAGSRRQDVRLARAQVRESEVNQEKILKELKRQIRQSYNQILSIDDSRRQTLKEIASSDALQQLNRENFKLGSINIIELIEGEERLNGAHAKLHQLDTDLYLNTYRLLITSGFLKQNFFCDSCNVQSVQAAAQ